MRADTLARARELQRPDTLYLLPVAGDGEVHDIEFTRTDLERSTAWLAEQLLRHGLGEGQRALLTCSGHEGVWAQVAVQALRSLKIPYAMAEAMGWDHRRTSVFHRQLTPHAVIGLSAQTVESLNAAVDLAEMFRDTPVLLARPDAAQLLQRAGLPASVFAPLGPALAVECPGRCGAHVDAAAWRIGARDGQLFVASGEGRASHLPETLLGVAGRVVTDSCECGSTDPRVLLQ